MYLKKLSLTGFKNYSEAEIEFCPKINCFVGNNGVGKTNLLDAIHYLSLTKSFFNNIDSANIRHGDEFFIVQGTFEKDGSEDSVFCSFHRQKQKVLKRNSKDYQRLSDHIGRFPVVMISPADYAIVAEGSEERRKFLNKIISQYDTFYLDSLLKYNKALLQRNRVLKDLPGNDSTISDLLSVWNSHLVKFGTYIYGERKKLVDELVPVFNEYYGLISGQRESVRLQYKSQLDEAGFELLLEKSIMKDRTLEYTTAGIHKDDLLLEMSDYPVKSLGSQGQQKSFLVALKLAKFDYIKKKAGLTPILLLDDIFDKFDAKRVKQIIKLVGNHRFGQIFISDTHHARLQEILSSLDTPHKLFSITEEGKIKESNS